MALAPVTPGEVLVEEFMIPLRLSEVALATELGVPTRRIGDLMAGRRRVSTDTAVRLSAYFGTSDGFWLNLQARYDYETECLRTPAERLQGHDHSVSV